jgi:hypothetical protein
VTPDLRGRIKIAAFSAASPSPTCCAISSRANSHRTLRRPIMTGNAAPRLRGGPVPIAHASDNLTHVELTWVEKQDRALDRFGREAHEQILDRRRRILSLIAPGSIFAFVRWAANDFGTIISRIDIVRAVKPRRAVSDAAFRAPGGDILLQDRRLAQSSGGAPPHRRGGSGKHRSLRGLRPITGATSINRLTAGHEPRAYTFARHQRLAPAAEDRRMTRFGYVMATYFSTMANRHHVVRSLPAS